jgi:hypothetical protein
LDTPAWDFRRLDEDDDSAFYSFPRRVVHIDDNAIAALTRPYAALVPKSGRVLDLMASWRSHLPASFGGPAIGLGLNAVEMAENPQLAAAAVHDLNREPGLPYVPSAPSPYDPGGRHAASPAGPSLTPGIARFTGAKASVSTAIAL